MRIELIIWKRSGFIHKFNYFDHILWANEIGLINRLGEVLKFNKPVGV